MNILHSSFFIFRYQNRIGNTPFAFVIEATVVGGTVENPLKLIEIQPNRGGTAAVKVEGIAAAEPAEDLL